MEAGSVEVVSRRGGRIGRLVLVVVGLVGLMVASGVVAVAAFTGFDDVPPTSTHATGIEWLAGSGVTGGCNPAGTSYCPGDPVTRAQMATFMHRLSGNAATPPSVNAAAVGGVTVDQLRPERVVVPASAFVPDGEAGRYFYSFATGTLFATERQCMQAAAPLPDGATIAAFNAYVLDQNAGQDVSIALRAKPYTSTSSTTVVADVVSSGSSLELQALRTTSLAASFTTVDTSVVSYSVTTCLEPSTQFNGAMIELSY